MLACDVSHQQNPQRATWSDCWREVTQREQIHPEVCLRESGGATQKRSRSSQRVKEKRTLLGQLSHVEGGWQHRDWDTPASYPCPGSGRGCQAQQHAVRDPREGSTGWPEWGAGEADKRGAVPAGPRAAETLQVEGPWETPWDLQGSGRGVCVETGLGAGSLPRTGG